MLTARVRHGGKRLIRPRSLSNAEDFGRVEGERDEKEDAHTLPEGIGALYPGHEIRKSSGITPVSVRAVLTRKGPGYVRIGHTQVGLQAHAQEAAQGVALGL